jgi:ABC-type multidrug transport system fused ATPase/permease subunit
MIARFTADIGTVETGLVTSFPFAIMALVEVLLSLGAAAYMSPTLALIGAAGLAISLVAPQPLHARAARSADALRNFEGQMTGVVQENLLGQEAVAAYGLKNEMAKRFTHLLQQRQRLWSRSRMLSYLLERIPATTFTLVQIVVLAVSGRLAVDGTITLGEMVSFQALFAGLSGALYNLTWVVPSLIDTFAALRRIEAIIGTEYDRHSQHQASNTTISAVAAGSPVPQGDLVFENVSFSYPGAERPVLEGVSFTASPGTTTAIVGGTGSGKSTLVSLICRLYDVTTGSIRVDNVDVRDYDTEYLWASVGLVPQRGYLFSGTVADNLRYGKGDATEDEMWAALRVAAADDFIAATPDGLATRVAQAGINFSGGQRQRLAIARAVIRTPAIYLLDDAFSALDTETDARVRAALLESSAGSTVIVVAQRISTVMAADQIIVLDAGRVVGVGRHDELLDRCAAYAEFAESQSMGTGVGGRP